MKGPYVSMPEAVERAADPHCPICDGVAWVCEDHPKKAWGPLSVSPHACDCGGAGMPCRCTGMEP